MRLKSRFASAPSASGPKISPYQCVAMSSMPMDCISLISLSETPKMRSLGTP